MLRSIYLSPLGYLISIVLNVIAVFHKPFMIYGFFNKVDGKYYKKTRIGSNVKLVSKNKIDIKDNVWVGYNCHIDGVGGVSIAKGVNVASHTCIYSHSSQDSIRLLGEKFIELEAIDRAGYIIDPVSIAEYTFIGTACVILPGTSIGKGSIVGAGSVVKGSFPDYSVIVGNPAKIVGDTREVDEKLYHSGADFQYYYDESIKKSFNK